jgi:hypothetical protein
MLNSSYSDFDLDPKRSSAHFPSVWRTADVDSNCPEKYLRPFWKERSKQSVSTNYAGSGWKPTGSDSTLSETDVVARLLQEMSERFQRRIGDVMLDPLGIGLGNLGRDT